MWVSISRRHPLTKRQACFPAHTHCERAARLRRQNAVQVSHQEIKKSLKSPYTIRIISIIGDFDKIKCSRFYSDVKTISPPGRCPIKSHFPTMQIAAETNGRIRKTLPNKIITKIANIKRRSFWTHQLFQHQSTNGEKFSSLQSYVLFLWLEVKLVNFDMHFKHR